MPQEALGGQKQACPKTLISPQSGPVGGGGTGEGQGVRCHFQGCPWMLAHEEHAQEALADPPYRGRQTETGKHVEHLFPLTCDFQGCHL